VGLKIEYGEMVEPAKLMGTFKTVSDKEHSEIIGLYIEGLGMGGIAKKLGRSSRTPLEHIHKHNDAVSRSGFCAFCKRIGSPNFNVKAARDMVLPSTMGEKEKKL